MFRSRARNRRIFSRRKPVRRFSWLSAIASVALFLILLELLTRIFVDISGNRSRFARSPESKPIEAYKLNVVASDRTLTSPDVAQITEAKPSDLQFLQIKNTIYTGYELVGNQDSQYWQINAQGFRDRDPVPLAKPQNEVRIFLLGGSTAFGYGSSSNAATISAQLEQRLQERLQQQLASPQLYKPDLLPANPEERQKFASKPTKIKPGNYRVVNAAVPGYASGNELAQVALEILKYDPDLIIVLDGYVDLMLPSQEKAVEISQIQQNNANRTKGSNKFDRFTRPVKDRSYLVQVVQDRWASSRQAENKADFILDERLFNLVEHLPGGEQELQNRVARYIENQRQILKLSAAAKIPLIVAIQPEITGRNATQLSDFEGEIATQLGRSYIRQVRNSYPAFIEATQQLAQSFPKNIKALDLYRLTDKYPSPSFIDPIHLNEAANEKLAEQLYYAISGFSKMQVVPQSAPAPKPAAGN